MKIKKLILPFIAIIFVLVIGLNFFVARTDKAYAESPLDPNDAYVTYTANNILVESTPSTGYFNNGYSFVFYGSHGYDGHLFVNIVLPNLYGYDFYNNTIVMSFNDHNKYENIHFAGFYLQYYDADVSDWRSFYSYYDLLPRLDFDFMVGNPYFCNIRSVDNYAVGMRIVFDFIFEENESYEFSFNDFYVYVFNDYSNAFNRGYDSGYSSAKNEYYNSRYELGYSDGFNEGASGQYSFFALISAVVETPINAVLGMLDFNFLDINLKSFFLSVFTIALIVMILRFVLAKT